MAQARAGMALPTIANRSHRKQSTINEHLLLAAIMGETLPIEHLVPLKIHRALDRVTQIYDHQALLAAIPESTFFPDSIIPDSKFSREVAACHNLKTHLTTFWLSRISTWAKGFDPIGVGWT